MEQIRTKNRFIRFVLRVFSFFLYIYAIVMVLGTIGVFLTPAIPNKEVFFLLGKLLAALAFLFLVKSVLKKPSEERKVGPPDENKQKRRRWWKVICVIVLFGMVLLMFVAPNKDIHSAVGKDKFNLFGWEVRTLLSELALTLTKHKTVQTEGEKAQALLVMEYFELVALEQALTTKTQLGTATQQEVEVLQEIQNGRAKLQNEVEAIIAQQIRVVLEDYGIRNPLNQTGIFFPPMLFKLETPPNLLIVSYRDRLEIKTSILIKPGLTAEELTEMEARVESLGYSAYTIETSGVSLFPTVVYTGSLRQALRTTAHEWLHIYINFRPLGGPFRLGSNNRERQTIEETIASIFGNEVGDAVWDRFYKPYLEQTSPPSTPQPMPISDKYFERIEFLIETREQVEQLLSEGKVEEAELYMRERRDILEIHGYYERKLNQAYFVARGFYATNPVYRSGQGGIGEKLIELRELSDSLADFVRIATGLKNLEDLDKALEKLR